MIAEVSALSEANVILVEDPRQLELATYGIQGPRGNAILSGSGLPSPSLGINDDLYLNFDNGFLYKKLANVWTYQTYIKAQQKHFDLEPVDIAAKQILLSPAPSSPGDVILEIIGGTTQVNGVDFDVTGNVLSWAGLGLDGILDDTDTIIVRY
jgi:hypothetical protein